MTRRLLKLLTVLWLLSCVAVVALVARSYAKDDSLQWVRLERGAGEMVATVTRVRLGWGRVTVERRSAVARYPYPDHAVWIDRLVDERVDFSYETRMAAAPVARFASVWQRLGFRGEHLAGLLPPGHAMMIGAIAIEPTTGMTDYLAIGAPVWPAAVLATLPLALACNRARRRIKRRRLLRAGLCVDCGYDLRGTPGRCPECGAVTAAAAGAPGP